MRLARGVVLCLAAAVLASTAAAAAWADTSATDPAATTDVTQSTDGTTAPTVAGTTETLAGTTETLAGTTDSSSVTESTSTETTGASPDTGTTVSSDVGPAIPVARPINRGCVFGGVALLLPNHAPLLIGPVANAPSAPVAAMSDLVYPADGSVVTAAGIALDGAGCTTGQPAGGKTELRSLSLFGGAVTADLVSLTIADAGSHHDDAISGLQVDGTAVQAEAGRKVSLGSWGYLVTGTLERIRTTAASGTEQPPLRVQASALSVHLLQRHAGLPAGTVLLISFAGLPGPAAAKTYTPAPVPATSQPVHVTPLAPKTPVSPLAPQTPVSAEKHHARTRDTKKHKGALHHAPWKVTPPLGDIHYVFPVTGASSFGDTYGAFRGDVPGNWHHGDDIFAPLGTPVVAVADGTVNRVGWQRIGGWRLWVVDKDDNRFYYAHLSGYAPAVIHSKTVKAGEVIGFLGNSGDAITTPPHLHFEIHPKGLGRYGYDGAVDPTRYLQGWSHLQHVRAPRPAHPRLPTAKAARQEARRLFRELLAARGLLKKPTPPPPPTPPKPSGTVLPPPNMAAAIVAATPQVAAAPPTPQPALPATTSALVGGSLLALLALSGSTLAVRRRKGRPAARAAFDATVPAGVAATPSVPVDLEPAAPYEPHRPTSETTRPAPGGLPLSVIGTGSLALVTASVLVLRRRNARARRRTDA